MKSVVMCMLWGLWGGEYADQYVSKLYRMVRRNTSVDFDFICLCDRPIRCRDSNIHILPIPPHITKWQFNLPKTYLHYPFEELKGRQILFFDLDTIIVGNIDHFLNYRGSLCGIEPFAPNNRGKHIGGGVLSFECGAYRGIFTAVEANPVQWAKKTQGGKERLLLKDFEEQYDGYNYWQKLHPSHVVSFKRHCKRNNIPTDARIIAFHGIPKPHEVIKNRIVRKYWR